MKNSIYIFSENLKANNSKKKTQMSSLVNDYKLIIIGARQLYCKKKERNKNKEKNKKGKCPST